MSTINVDPSILASLQMQQGQQSQQTTPVQQPQQMQQPPQQTSPVQQQPQQGQQMQQPQQTSPVQQQPQQGQQMQQQPQQGQQMQQPPQGQQMQPQPQQTSPVQQGQQQPQQGQQMQQPQQGQQMQQPQQGQQPQQDEQTTPAKSYVRTIVKLVDVDPDRIIITLPEEKTSKVKQDIKYAESNVHYRYVNEDGAEKIARLQLSYPSKSVVVVDENGQEAKNDDGSTKYKYIGMTSPKGVVCRIDEKTKVKAYSVMVVFDHSRDENGNYVRPDHVLAAQKWDMIYQKAVEAYSTVAYRRVHRLLQLSPANPSLFKNPLHYKPDENTLEVKPDTSPSQFIKLFSFTTKNGQLVRSVFLDASGKPVGLGLDVDNWLALENMRLDLAIDARIKSIYSNGTKAYFQVQLVSAVVLDSSEAKTYQPQRELLEDLKGLKYDQEASRTLADQIQHMMALKAAMGTQEETCKSIAASSDEGAASSAAAVTQQAIANNGSSNEGYDASHNVVGNIQGQNMQQQQQGTMNIQ